MKDHKFHAKNIVETIMSIKGIVIDNKEYVLPAKDLFTIKEVIDREHLLIGELVKTKNFQPLDIFLHDHGLIDINEKVDNIILFAGLRVVHFLFCVYGIWGIDLRKDFRLTF